VAAKNDDQQWLQIDLEKPARVHALQVNYNDYKSKFFGKQVGIFHRYLIEGSLDGKTWFTLVDRANNYRDVPNDYVELGAPKTMRYVRYKNIHVPTVNLSISDLRVFGVGEGKKPTQVKALAVTRQKDRRNASITWAAQPGAQGYNVLWGIAPDKLYSSWMLYGKNALELKSLTSDQPYYFSIEAFNETGVSEKVKVIKVL
jgi:hypothetical protein